MKKSKRFFAAMMAAAMTAGMLTGCGGGAKKESAAPAESAQGAAQRLPRKVSRLICALFPGRQLTRNWIRR